MISIIKEVLIHTAKFQQVEESMRMKTLKLDPFQEDQIQTEVDHNMNMARVQLVEAIILQTTLKKKNWTNTKGNLRNTFPKTQNKNLK